MANSALQHRMRHFPNAGLIPRTGPVSNQIDSFKDLLSNIMNSAPLKTVKDGDNIKFLHEYYGETVLVEIYGSNHPLADKVKQAVIAGEGQIAKIMNLPEFTP